MGWWGSTDNWNEDANWVDPNPDDGFDATVAPESGNSLTFGGETRTSTNNNLTGVNSDWLVSQIMFENDGTVGGATTINGIHSPGNATAGVQTFGSDLTYSGGSSVLWELFDDTTSGRGTSFDGIDVGGDLTFASATTLELDFTAGNVEWNSDFWERYKFREWQIWNVAGNINYGAGLGLSDIGITFASSGNDGLGNAFDPGNNVPSSANFSLFENASAIYLRYEAVPEPTTFGLIMGGLTIFTRRRRRISAST